MTNEEAIELLKNMHWSIMTKMNREVPSSLALLMAIEALGKDTNVPSKSALDHIHNVVRDDSYRRGYEQGRADAIPIDWLMQRIDEWKSDGGYACDFGARLLTALINDWKRKKNET